jgi:asparagine synthase (glutamine-hydrolysing)
MSVQCGMCSFDSPVDPKQFADLVESARHRYDRTEVYSSENLRMCYYAFDTTPESTMETQPYRSVLGPVLTWDGRLDNRDELISELHALLTDDRTDVAIVMAAYERWGIRGFAKLLGDWALALWDPRENALLLARDFIGTRQLFYHRTPNGISWSTLLSSILKAADMPLSLDEEYIAGYFVLSPSPERSPYRGIWQLPPGTFVTVKEGSVVTREYWNFDPSHSITYKKDTEYEEHFRELFSDSVRRRLRSNTPVLAELSGGMDSSSIVCVADRLISDGSARIPRLDTISYYDDLEPNWDERTYFTLVEARRGQKGIHLDASGGFTFDPPFDPEYFSPVPPGLDQSAILFETKRRACMREANSRALLSGIGGDEFLGGLPTPIPELANLAYRRQFRALLQRTKAWSLSRKQPLLHLLLTTASDFFPATLSGLRKEGRIPRWLCESFVRRYKESFLSCTTRSDPRGPLPSFQANCGALRALRRQVCSAASKHDGEYEVRYPYLDRDLLQFLFSIPREQLVRPGRRRCLMRRALAGIVPEQILERRRKAFVVRGPMSALSSSWPQISALTEHMISDTLGFVDRTAFLESLESARQGREEPVVIILQALRLELWLRNALGRGILSIPGIVPLGSDQETTVRLHPTPELTRFSHLEKAIESDMLKLRQIVLENLGGLGSSPGYEADE